MEFILPKTCAAFYNHANLRPGNRIFPCCRFKFPIQEFDGNVSEILHSPQYATLRSADVEDLPECSKCMYEEQNGKPSLREQFNKRYSTDQVSLRYLEIGFDNICDLACDGCSSEWSHTWALKENQNNKIKQSIKSTLELQNVPESIDRVSFLGGEPLMTNRHRTFLKTIKNLENLEVLYYTNGMHSLQNEDYDILKKCKTVSFIVSIDGYGPLNEKVRSNSSWRKVIQTTKEISAHFDTVVHTTIHANNWHGLVDLLNWTTDNKYNWSTNILTYPRHLDIINLSKNNKADLISILNNFNIPNSSYIMEHLNECT